MHRHHQRRDQQDLCRKLPDIGDGVVDQREEGGCRSHHSTEDNAQCKGKGDQLPVLIHRSFQLTRSQQLPHHDGGRVSGGDEGTEEEIGDGRVNVHRGHNLESADGIALVQNRHSPGPEQFVDHQRKPQPDHLPQNLLRYLQAPVQAEDKGVSLRVTMGPDHHDAHLHHPGQHGRRSGSHHAQRRCTEFSEDENIVKYQIHAHRDQTCLHRQYSLSGLAQCAGIYGCDDKGQQLQKHDVKIVLRVAHRCFQIQTALPLMKKQPDKGFAGEAQHSTEHRQDRKSDDELYPDRLPDALLVSLAVKLCRQDPGAGHAAQRAEVEDKDELVHNGDAAHRLRSDLPDHDVVQHGDKVCDDILDQDRNQDGKYPPIEVPIPYIPLHSLRFLSCLSASNAAGIIAGRKRMSMRFHVRQSPSAFLPFCSSLRRHFFFSIPPA